MEWTFTTKPDSSITLLKCLCSLVTDHRVSVLYCVHDGVEVSESQHEQFAGRVRSEKDVLRDGRIRLHVSRLKTEDSGLYVCDVKTDYGFSSGRCQLNVSGELNLISATFVFFLLSSIFIKKKETIFLFWFPFVCQSNSSVSHV